MFSFSFAVVLLITFGVNGQNNDINTFHSNNVEKGYPFGKLRLSEDGKTEELISASDIEKSPFKQDQPSSGVQPLPSPCIGTSESTKIAYPKDKTKYIQCRDEFHYEIYTCPNGGDYNEQTNTCDLTIPIVDKCEQEKPCLNDGQCIVLSDSTFKCTCRADWTGDRCETPVNSCVKKPCGPHAECRSLKTTDYEQDYVCVCHGTRGYGLNCQEAVPNPCLTTTEQFFPFAFSQRAYIQCDGELIYFQPCGPLLYWHQEEKICDRKRPAKIDLPALLTKYAASIKENQQEKETGNEDIALTTTTEQTEQQNQYGKENEAVAAFVPARVANRQQLLANINNQQQNFPQKNQVFTSQQRLNQDEDITPKSKQLFGNPSQSWQGSQPTQNQPLFQTQNQQGAFQTATVPSNVAFQQGLQSQNNPTQVPSWQNPPNTQFGGIQSPQSVGFPGQNTQNFAQQQQQQQKPWQGSQPFQNQQQFQNPHQQPFFETATVPPNVPFQQGFQNQNNPTQVPSWQNPPNTQFGGIQSPQSGGFQGQNTQNFAQQQQQKPLQTSQQFPNPHQQPFIETATVPQNVAHLQGFQNQNNPTQVPSWQNPPNTQFGGVQPPQSVGFQGQNTQNFGQQQQQQPWQGSQPFQNQQQFQNPHQQPFFETATVPQNVAFQQGLQNPSTQFGGIQSPQSVGFPGQNTQNFAQQQQQQPWQGSQAFQNQQQFQNSQNPGAQFSGIQSPQSGGFPPQNTQNFMPQPWQKSQNQTVLPKQIQQPPIETTTVAQNVVRSQALQNSSVLSQDQSLQTTGINPQPFIPKQQPWQNSQSFQNQQQLTPMIPEALLVDNKNRFNKGIQQNNKIGFEQQPIQNQQPWQNKGTNQMSQNFVQPETSLIDIQRPPLNIEQNLAGQPVQNQQWSSNLQSSTDFKNGQLQKGIPAPIKQNNQQQDLPQQTQVFNSQQRFNQNPNMNTKNNQGFGSQTQSWQGSQKIQNQQPFLETTTIAQNVNRFPGLQNSNTELNQVYAFQPKQWQDTSKQTLNTHPSSDIQIGFNQQQTTNDQRKPLDTVPTILSGSWKTRS